MKHADFDFGDPSAGNSGTKEIVLQQLFIEKEFPGLPRKSKAGKVTRSQILPEPHIAPSKRRLFRVAFYGLALFHGTSSGRRSFAQNLYAGPSFWFRKVMKS